jgi:tetratricopeptide (TPR) repeat protein
MRATLRKLLIFIPFTLLSTLPCWGQGQTGTIDGDVKGLDGKPLAGAEIKLTRTDVKGNYHTKTDKKGHYIYSGLPLGTYNVEVDLDGKMVDGTDHVPTHIMAITDVNFDLKATAEKNGGALGGAAAAEPARNMTPAQKAQMEKEMKDQQEKMAKNKELNDAFNAGKEAVAAKNWDAAVDAFTKATTLAPTEHVVWANMADAYVSRAGTKTGADMQSDLDKAISSYQKAIEIKGDDPAYHNNYALTLAKEKKFDEAQSELTKAAQLDAANAGKYYYNLGALYVNTGQMEPAGTAFQKAIELQPSYADSYYQYGLYLMGKATTDASGKLVPPAGTADAFNKYLSIAPTGQFADAAKAMMQSFGATVETNFSKTPAQNNSNKKK